MKKKRGWSREFPSDQGADYTLNAIPEGIWRAFRAQCTRRGVSLRVRLITLIKRDAGEVQP